MTVGSPPTDVAALAGGWADAPAALTLGSQDVHVWRVFLDDAAWAVERPRATLSPDERRRAGSFAFARDRRRFEVRRGVLRLLLARYLGGAPRAVDLREGPHGKPALAVAPGDPPVEFNCSHSRGLALYAFTRGRRVGVDVEAARPLPEAHGIAELCFSPRERSELAALPPGGLEQAVLSGWTMKEAYVKAVGDGLATPLDGIEVTVTPAGPPTLRAIDGSSRKASGWCLHTLSLGHRYVAALVVEGGDACELHCWTAQPAPVRSQPGPTADATSGAAEPGIKRE